MKELTLIDIAWKLYIVVTVLYGIYLAFGRNRILGIVCTLLLLVAFAFHTAFGVTRIQYYWDTTRWFLFPYISYFEALSFFTWSIVLVYIGFEFITKIKVFGPFMVAIPVIVLAFSQMIPVEERGPRTLMPALKSPWLDIHVLAMFISYAAFTIAFVCAVLFLLKTAFPGMLPALDKALSPDGIDLLSYRMIAFAYPFLTFGVIAGAIWADKAWGTYWAWDPKETWAFITWLIYSVYLHMRITMRWKGTSAAMVNILGFVVVLITFIGVNFIVQFFKLESQHTYI